MQNGRQFWQEIMDEKQLKKILKLTVNERYEYFLERAVDAKMLWALKDSSGWLLFGDNHEKSIMTLWPEKDFAEIYGKGLSLKCKAASISLDIFLDEFTNRSGNATKRLGQFCNDLYSLFCERRELLNLLQGSHQGRRFLILKITIRGYGKHSDT